ncbi:MAG: hypothetical protein JWM58_4091 [Rhizobium sp.]|nr:hypothetical protein [Rhizobium sp.]
MTFRPSRLMLVVLAASLAAPLTSFAAGAETREAAIIVSGDADASVPPDLAIVTLGVTRMEKTAREALDGNNKAMSGVLKAMKDQGIADRDLQTSGFGIQPQYLYPDNADGTQKPPVLTGYEVSNLLTIRVRDLGKLGAILDQAVTLGINQGGDIRFTNDNPEKTIETARTSAMKNAIAKARTLAAAAGVKLGRIIEITENTSRPEPRPLMRMSMAKEASDAVPVAAGENSYSVNVNVTFAIEQ